MEYLEGETLADRLQKGALPLDQALQYAIQTADALAAAQRAGITHRDLKPGNIMLTKAGPKVLDFGLAKHGAGMAGAGVGPTSLPTMSAAPTAQGTILGTLQYMAPEQLEGKDADARTDIFAFGAMLYEMLTGKRAFQGTSQVSLIAAILEHDPPPIAASQPLTPPLLDHIVKRCLAKDPDERWQAASDVMRELTWIAEGSAQVGTAAPRTATVRTRERLAWLVAAVAAAAAVGVGALHFARARPEPAAAIRFQVSPPAGTLFSIVTAAGAFSQSPSPDGRRIAFVVVTGTQTTTLAIRSFDTADPQVIAGTEGAVNPFWSPDSRFVGFFAQGKLKKIDVTGGPPLTLCDASAGSQGGTWNSEDTILFAPSQNGGLFRVSAAGGTPAPVTTVDAAKREPSHRYPWFLPDSRHFLYVTAPSTSVYVGSLDSQERVQLVPADSKAIYAGGHLLFIRQGTLLAQPFDAARLTTTGEAFPVAENVGYSVNGAAFSASATGVLAYRAGVSGILAHLVWSDREGRQLGEVGPPADYRGIAVSPDGGRIATHFDSTQGNGDIWVIDVERGTNTRFTFDANRHYQAPVWSPDGTHIAYWIANGRAGIFQKVSSGAGQDEPLVEAGDVLGQLSWSQDGRFILFRRVDPKTRNDIWALPLFGDRKPFPALQTAFDEDYGQLSSDGRWIVYQSDESGRPEVYVQPFPTSGGKWQVSTSGGTQPRWRADGKELFYLGPDRKLMAVAVGTDGATFTPSTPRPLFDWRPGNAPGGGYEYAPARDGQRFLVTTAKNEGETSSPITVVLNWTAGLKK